MMCLYLILRLIGPDARYTKLSVKRILAKYFAATYKKRLFHAQYDLFREKRLIGVRRRADRVAASTLCASVAIEQLFPGKLLGLRDTVILALFDVLQERESAFGLVV